LRPAPGDGDGRELVLFVHGLWLHASSWREWALEFDRAGYDCLSFRWPGEPTTAAA
jgi:non-heme chloroperoxidase